MRAREESGFGLLELLMAMVMLNIGILAIVAAFNSGALALGRASKASTAAAVAEQQLEALRGVRYANIAYKTSEWTSAIADSSYTADTVYSTNMASPPAPKRLTTTQTTCPNSNANTCDPSFSTTGADGRSYRVDTYLYYDTPTDGNELKTVTVVVRDPSATSRSLARQTSTFDTATG